MKKQRVLVCFDGSEHSERAINYAISNFDRGTHIELVYVEEAITPLYLSAPSLFVDTDIIKRIRDGAKKRLMEKADYIKRKGFSADYAYREGYPADEIIKESKKSKADIIIAGSRGMGKWKGSLLGSVSQSLAIRSQLPVLIIK